MGNSIVGDGALEAKWPPFVIPLKKPELLPTLSDSSAYASDFSHSTILKKSIPCLRGVAPLWAHPFLSVMRFSSPADLLFKPSRVNLEKSRIVSNKPVQPQQTQHLPGRRGCVDLCPGCSSYKQEKLYLREGQICIYRWIASPLVRHPFLFHCSL